MRDKLHGHYDRLSVCVQRIKKVAALQQSKQAEDD